MECQNKGLWHTGISDEACENAGGKWIRTPCVTLKETVNNRPARFNLETPELGYCQDVVKQDTSIRLDTDFVSADMNRLSMTTHNDCNEFCRSLPDYSIQIGMMIQTEAAGVIADCKCIYPNGRLPSRQSLPVDSVPSPPKFALTNSDGMALGLRPKIACEAEQDLVIETQVADSNNPLQQFHITPDGQIVSLACPAKVLTAMLGGDGTECTDGVGLQLKEYSYSPRVLPTSVNAPDLQRWMISSGMSVLRDASYSNSGIDPGDGQYFSYNPEDVKLYFGIDFDNDTIVFEDVKQCRNGVTKYQGKIRLIKPKSALGHGYIGQVEGVDRQAGDWDDNDVIVKSTDDCNLKSQVIRNVGCPNLAISSSKEKDVRLPSVHYALQNPRTQFAIGISSESCTDGMTL
eukprot:scaffold16397_cov36-Cyclotella_meneghiniana.AAC.1